MFCFECKHFESVSRESGLGKCRVAMPFWAAERLPPQLTYVHIGDGHDCRTFEQNTTPQPPKFDDDDLQSVQAAGERCSQVIQVVAIQSVISRQWRRRRVRTSLEHRKDFLLQ